MLTKGNLITDKSGEMKKSLLTSNKRGLDLRGLEKTVAISKNLDGLKTTPSRSEKDLKGLGKPLRFIKNLDGLNITLSRSKKDLKGARNKTFEV